MKLTKFGHSCFLIEENNIRILFDPGSFSTIPNNLKNIDFILITHEHADHCDLDSLKNILKDNLTAKIFTNNGVGAVLKKDGIAYEILEDGQNFIFKDVLIEAFGDKHSIIYSGIPQIQNTGYFINNKFFYPGDNFINPGKPIPVLALPISAPWMKISEALDYALALAPRKCLPAHDGILVNPNWFHRLPKTILENNGIEFLSITDGEEIEF